MKNADKIELETLPIGTDPSIDQVWEASLKNHQGWFGKKVEEGMTILALRIDLPKWDFMWENKNKN